MCCKKLWLLMFGVICCGQEMFSSETRNDIYQKVAAMLRTEIDFGLGVATVEGKRCLVSSNNSFEDFFTTKEATELVDQASISRVEQREQVHRFLIGDLDIPDHDKSGQLGLQTDALYTGELILEIYYSSRSSGHLIDERIERNK